MSRDPWGDDAPRPHPPLGLVLAGQMDLVEELAALDQQQAQDHIIPQDNDKELST